ncbi:transmembrane channel-like isoform X2 [Brevipalpus obovatus]
MGDDTILVQFDNRRLSSFCASSNDETMITIDDALTEEEIVETLKAHKQIIANIKTQSWPMHRKLRILRRAKMYIKKHEGDLKQSKQAKDIVAKYRTYLEKTVNRLKREINNLVVQLTPWEMRIKKIESQFGSVVASYFTFLRWIFWINTFISIFLGVFVLAPEIMRGSKDATQMRKYEVSGANLTYKDVINTIWNFNHDYIKYSPIFYGYYDKDIKTSIGYNIPLAYFGTTMVLYAFSFFCILRKMAANARMSRVGSKEDEYVFTWKLFTGWDFMIGNSETAYNKVASIVMSFKEVILEEKERKKETKNWKVIARHILANILITILLCSSAYAVVLVVQRSEKIPEGAGWIRSNEVQLVLNGVQTIFPPAFGVIAHLETYHPRTALRWQLGRILVLNLLNLFAFLFSTFDKVGEMTNTLLDFKKNISLIHASLGSEMSGESNSARLRVLLWQSPEMLANRQKRDEGRLFPPEEFVVSTESAPFDPYSRNDLDEEEPIDGRYFMASPDGGSTLGQRNSGRGDQPEETTTIQPNGEDPGGGGPSTSGSDYSQVTSESQSSSSMATSGSISTRGSPMFTPSSFTTVRGSSPTIRGTTLSGRKTNTTTSPSGLLATSLPLPFTTVEPSSSSRSTTLSPKDSGPRKNKTSSTPIPSVPPSSSSLTLAPPTTTSGTLCQETTTQFSYDARDIYQLTTSEQIVLRDLCWETMFGQEIAKTVVSEIVFTVFQLVVTDFGRAVFIRYCNGCSCIFWDIEKHFPGYADFQIAENMIQLITNQGNIWLGMFFSPGLPALNTVKLCVMMYVRSWAVLTSNVPHDTVFKASGSNNFYYALLLLMLFICTLPVGFAVVWLQPSWHCGPFSDYDRIYQVFTKFLEKKLPDKVNTVIDYLSSPGTVIPVLMLLILIIYYLMSTVSSLREANSELKIALRKEKDEGEDEQRDGLPIDAVPTDILTPGIEKKHVRINDDTPDDSDKAKLISHK